MNIAIIGSGNVGSALAKGWQRKQHNVIMGVRDAQSDKARKAQAALQGIEFAEIETAIQRAEVVVITTPPDAVASLKNVLQQAKGKVIIDTTNAVRTRPEPYSTAFHYIKAECGIDTVVKCFNSTGFENMENPLYNGMGIDMFCAGNNAQAKSVAKQLSADIGFGNCWDFGGDDKVELLEKFALSWINLAIMQGHGRNLAFRVVKR